MFIILVRTRRRCSSRVRTPLPEARFAPNKKVAALHTRPPCAHNLRLSLIRAKVSAALTTRDDQLADRVFGYPASEADRNPHARIDAHVARHGLSVGGYANLLALAHDL